ncbi:MAG: helicase [Alphaproteobacteria bacterium]|nr:helicase [Alphaproteobacteria bacterium]
MNIPVPAHQSFPRVSTRGVTVLLGPTNTGKTHYAIERMLSHSSGMIGLPLRLLAREVYYRTVEKAGADAVALITGEEKIKPAAPRYWIATVEAMPRELDLAFVAIDEIQLAADLDRGHIFTNRILSLRGREETLLIGAATMHQAVRALLPGARVIERPRLSKLSFAGEKKISRLPGRSAIVAFSAEDVYSIAEWIRRQCGGAAVVLGALSPRTRNAQVDMFQNGLVDYIVATDAIGMGLNLDVDHIAFATDRKFDGWQYRRLTGAEFGQIAGRAGRHLRDGTFGTTGRCPPFDAPLVDELETHRFEPVRMLQWRNSNLDFSSITALSASLDILPKAPGLTRAPLSEDQIALEFAARDEGVRRRTRTWADVTCLWECCQIPDYRKLSPAAHGEIVVSVFNFVKNKGHIQDDWFARHIAAQDRTDGSLEMLSARLAEIRTWTFIANHSGWLRDPSHWQSIARQVEDNLSDALHERLAQRFVDRRTSVLMRRLRENAMLEAEITLSGDVVVEGQHVGQLNGFRFTPDPAAVGEAAKALNAAAQKALASEIEGRASRVSEAVDDAFILANDGIIRWLGEPIGKLLPGAHVLTPQVMILADEQLSGHALEMVQRRLDLWLAQHIKKLLGPLQDLEIGEGLEGVARGLGFQIAESLGVLDRTRVAEEVKSLSQEARASLRKFGVRFGAYHLYLPGLIKPAPRALAAQLFALKHGGNETFKGLDEVLHLAASGRTSLIADKNVQKNLYRAAGFRICGERAVRVDILERLADLIRPAISYKPGITPGEPPPGAADGDGFVVTVAMTSLAGCSGESFASILRALGYVSNPRKGPPITVPLLPTAETQPQHQAEPCADQSSAPEDEKAAPEFPGQQDGDDRDVTNVPTADAEPISDSGERAACGETQAALSDVTCENPAQDGLPVPTPTDISQDTPAATSEVETSLPAPKTTVEEPPIEIWHPHRPHHNRRSEVRGAKKPFERAKVSAPSCTLNPEDTQFASPCLKSPASIAKTPREISPALQVVEHSPRRKSKGSWKEESHRGGNQNPRFSGPGGRKQTAGQKRGDGERIEQLLAKEKQVDERQPDPNSPFAKLLILKAQLEEKTRRAKDNSER